MGNRGPVGFIVEVFEEFSRDGCVSLAGSLAFFTLFSFPPLLAVVVDTIALFTGGEQAIERIHAGVEAIFGDPVANQTIQVIDAVKNTHHDGSISRILGIALAMFSASVVLAQAQRALNQVWQVDASSGVEGFLLKRAIGLLVTIISVGLMLIGMTATTIVAVIGDRLQDLLSDGLAGLGIRVLTNVILFVLLWVAATLLHKLLPERRLPTRDVLVGGGMTAALLVGGQVVVSWILNTVGMGSAYGAARSLAVMLFWVFYGSAIFLWGAEFTKVWARRNGRELVPSPADNAIKRLAKHARKIRIRRFPRRRSARSVEGTGR